MEDRELRIEKCDGKVQWDEFVLEHGGHPLQLWGWGDVKTGKTWSVDRFFIIEDDVQLAAVQLLVRKLPRPFGKLLYIPRGPVVADPSKLETIYDQLAKYVKREYKAIALVVEPNLEQEPTGKLFRTSKHNILAPHTIVLDLKRPEGVLLAEMSKKTRQYIRKSAADGVTVRRLGNPDEIKACLDIYKETAKRAGFNIHKDAYYQAVSDKMGDYSVIFGAYSGNDLVSFLWLAVSESVAFELYGGVTDLGQKLRANYTLKWEAIRRSKQWGITSYDVNGLINDGINNFKQGFASHTTDFGGTYELPLSPFYTLWNRMMPSGKRFLQRLRSKPGSRKQNSKSS